MKIEISNDTAVAILKLDERYFFDLFKSVRINQDEECEFRDAINEIANEITCKNDFKMSTSS